MQQRNAGESSPKQLYQLLNWVFFYSTNGFVMLCTTVRMPRWSGLPKECAAVVLELKKRPSPRSPSFTSPVAVMNTLAGLMSESHRKHITDAPDNRSRKY